MAYCAECGEQINSPRQKCWEMGGVCIPERQSSGSAQAPAQAAEYKGRRYRLLWMGATKYGKRAHLQFFDGSKDFWCDANLVRA